MSSAWSQLDQLLTCAICLDRYKNPKLLPCQHTFCGEPCLEGLVDYARRQIKCPECRAEHRIPYQGTQAFPNNVTLVRFLELHRSITGEEPEPPPVQLERCGVCSERSSVERCAHCDKKVCTDCREAHAEILRRELTRLSGQVRRGLLRISEALTQAQRNSEKLERCGTQAREEVDEVVRRCVHDVTDKGEKLRHEIEIALGSELREVHTLRENLEQEVSTMGSNCEMIEKYVAETEAGEQWTDAELVEYKDVFLKSLEFLRNFDGDTADYGRRIKFQHHTDPEVLHKTLTNFGEIKINAPPITSLTPAPLSPSSSSSLMRSQSDHRLAFHQRRSTSGGHYSGGHVSDSEQREFSRASEYRRSRDYDSSDRETGRSRFLRDDGTRSSWRNAEASEDSGTFRSRFVRDYSDEHDDSGHRIGRTVRFMEEPAAPQRERLLETDDVTKAPLSGVIRLLDSPYVMARLYQNEIRIKQDQQEKERKALEPPPPAPAPITVPPVRRTPSRQVSEDEIEKQKKANQQASSSSTPSSPPPAVVPTPPHSPLNAVPPTSERPLPRRLASLQKEPTEERTTDQPPATAESSGSSSPTSRVSPLADDPERATTRSWRRPSVDETVPQQRRQIRCVRPPPLGTKSLSLDNRSVDKKDERSPQQSSFFAKRRPSVTVSDSESEESESSDGGETKETPIPLHSPSVSTLLARSALVRRESAETSSPSYVSTRHSHYAREKEREEQQRPSGYRRRDSRDDGAPAVARTGGRRTAEPPEPADDMPAYSRYLARSRSSALIDGNNPPDERRALQTRRSRISRSRSSHDVAHDDSGAEDETSTTATSYRRPSETSLLSRSRSQHALKRESSPTDEPPPSSTTGGSWASYLRNKYGTKGRTVTRSRSSHALYSRSGSDNSSEEEEDEGGRGGGGHSYSFTFPRSMYMQKKRMVMRIGCRGTEPSCFTWPRGVAIGMDNCIVVADSSNHRVQVFDVNGKYLQEFGTYGSGEGQFDCLAGVAVNRIGQFIVSDRYNHRIQVFDPSGRFLREFGCEGRADGRFSYPWGITTDSLGFIYVCDKENHRIQVFQSDGTFVGKFGSIGSRPGFLEHPHYIAVSTTNRVIVSDTNNHRVQIFDVNGRSLATFGTEGSDEGQFKFPRGIAVDDQGYIIVGDSGNNRVQIFHPDGTFLRMFGTWGASEGEFKGLEGIAVMSNGNILVCDRENHRIQVF